MEPETFVETPVEPVETLKAWPTTTEFMSEATQPEAVAFAAYEILSIQAGLIKALMRCTESPIPTPIKVFFEKKIRSAVAQLYAGIPNQVVPMVEWMVMEEQLGGPEAIAKLQAQLDAEKSGVLVSTGSTAASNPASEGSNPSGPANVAELPKIPEQWPVQLGADNQLHIVKQEPQPDAKVLQFKRPEPTQPTEPDGPSGGTPVAVAA